MMWEREALGLLERNFGPRAFEAENAAGLLNSEKKYTDGTCYRILHDLTRDGKINRIGRGLYYIDSESTSGIASAINRGPPRILFSEIDKKARDVLEKLGITFMITGPSLLSIYIHHFPRKMMHLIYAMKGSGESVKDALRNAGLRSLLKPTRSEINLALEEFPEKDIFVVREISDFRGVNSSVADFERALVDTYYETTRGRIGFPSEELGRMVSTVFWSTRVNIPRLLMFAERRGIKSEMGAVLNETVRDLELNIPTVNNDKVAPVLTGIRSEGR